MSESRFVLRPVDCKAPPAWTTVSFSCPVPLRDEINRLADEAGWARGKFLYHLLSQVIPLVQIELPESLTCSKPDRVYPPPLSYGD